MQVDRVEIKRQSRQLIRTAQPKVLYASIIFVAILALFTYLQSRLTGVSYDQLNQYYQLVQEGSLLSAQRLLQNIAPKPTASLIDTLLQIVTYILSAGFMVFLFNTARGTGAVYGNLLDGFGPYFRLALLRIVMNIFTMLWSLLFVIPGIIAIYKYSMAPYIMLDHPDYSIMECIRKSKEMTYGYKGQLFVLDLSLIGYVLLTAIPYLGYIARAYYLPYRGLCYIGYYEQLRRQRDAAFHDPVYYE